MVSVVLVVSSVGIPLSLCRVREPKSRKIRKNYKIPLLDPTTENREKLPKNYPENAILCNVPVLFPYIVAGGPMEGNFVIFSSFRDFPFSGVP